MMLVLIVFVLFVLAFAGLACGVLIKGRGLRGSCHTPASDHDCQCREERKPSAGDATASCCQTGNRKD